MIRLLHKLVKIQGDQGTYHKRDLLKYSFYTWAKIKKHIQGLLRFMAATAALSQITRDFSRYRWECNCQKAIYIGTVRDWQGLGIGTMRNMDDNIVIWTITWMIT